MNYQHLYIHIPFCSNKCKYCAFYSESCASPQLRAQFLTELNHQLEQNSPHLQNLKTIFIGGGTPTLLECDELIKLFASIHNFCDTSKLLEWSIESNPETLSSDKIAVLKNAGVNRVSVGIQSFNKNLRQTIGRAADPDKIGQTVEKLQKNDINNINFDLIYGIPGQSPDMWLNDLKTAVQYPISHISAYSLTIEEGSELAKEMASVNDEEAVEMQNSAIEFLKDNGFNRYEISNFCKNGRNCQHNNGIWHGETYLGLGPAAASFDGSNRFHQTPSLQSWLQQTPPELDIISEKARARELFVIGLRTTDGWNLKEFKNKTGLSVDQLYKNELNELINSGFLKRENGQIYPTSDGLLFADHIAVKLI